MPDTIWQNKISHRDFPGGAVVAGNPPASSGTWVQVLVREDPTCRGATKPVRHTTEPGRLEPVLPNKRSHRNEKPVHCNEE